ncbi:2,3-bisphosphoglycerate-independent phosphoglycerate mutase [Kaarinaea lacus]
MTSKKNLLRRPVLLVILDGFGINPNPEHNGVVQANTPHLDEYFTRYPSTALEASGHAVGLPDGQMGNSEVGHLTLGCGQVIRQDLVSIDDAIENGSFYDNTVLLDTINKAKSNGKPAHLIGLVSDGGVHSHINHLLALIKMCQRHGVKPLVHMITDGRDTPPKSAKLYLAELEAALDKAQGRIVSVMGRYYAMDRDRRWDRTEKAWRALALGQAEVTADSAEQAIDNAYQNDFSDEFIPPTLLSGECGIGQGDAVIFFNFRKDRARQLTSALSGNDFSEFPREDCAPVSVTCMTEYDEYFHLPYAFCQDRPKVTLAEIISQQGLNQFHCAETEKYAHVTYFFNGRVGEAYPNEDRVIVPSPKVATYDEAPAMSAREISDEVITAIEAEKYSFIVVNYANGDMVGHTGKPEAIIQSIEALDREVGRLLDCAVEYEYSVILTADHGNCEEMVDVSSGAPHTQHTVYPVPCLVIDKNRWQLASGAGLSSVAPTVLQLMGIDQPDTIPAHSLLISPVAKAS